MPHPWRFHGWAAANPPRHVHRSQRNRRVPVISLQPPTRRATSDTTPVAVRGRVRLNEARKAKLHIRKISRSPSASRPTRETATGGHPAIRYFLFGSSTSPLSPSRSSVCVGGVAAGFFPLLDRIFSSTSFSAFSNSSRFAILVDRLLIAQSSHNAATCGLPMLFQLKPGSRSAALDPVLIACHPEAAESPAKAGDSQRTDLRNLSPPCSWPKPLGPSATTKPL